MPLPFLIGAVAAAAAVTAVAVAVLSDDSSSSGSYSDNEGDERRKAERERREAQLEEKMQALDLAYEERLESDRLKLKSLLVNVSKVENMQKSMMLIEEVPEIDMNPDGSHKKVLSSKVIKNKKVLDKFHSNTVLFENLYHGNVNPKKEATHIANSIELLEERVQKIKNLVINLES